MHWSYAETTMKLSGRSTETKLYIINPLDPLFLLRRLKVKYMFHIATGEILENTIPMISIAKLDTLAEYYIKPIRKIQVNVALFSTRVIYVDITITKYAWILL